MKYLIANIPFNTKKDITTYVRDIVKSYDDEIPLSHDDFLFMRSLLERHQDANIKIGCGVRSMCIQPAKIYGGKNRCFCLTRTDDTVTDFSWLECIYPTPHEGTVKSALRHAIDEQTFLFKQSYFDNTDDPRCVLTGEKIEFKCSHVDHIPPDEFDDLTKRFLFEEGLRFDQVEIISTEDGQLKDRLVDDALCYRWQEYHREHARLRVISKQAHLLLPC